MPISRVRRSGAFNCSLVETGMAIGVDDAREFLRRAGDARPCDRPSNGTAAPVAGDAPANRAEHVCLIGPEVA